MRFRVQTYTLKGILTIAHWTSTSFCGCSYLLQAISGLSGKNTFLVKHDLFMSISSQLLEYVPWCAVHRQDTNEMHYDYKNIIGHDHPPSFGHVKPFYTASIHSYWKVSWDVQQVWWWCTRWWNQHETNQSVPKEFYKLSITIISLQCWKKK